MGEERRRELKRPEEEVQRQIYSYFSSSNGPLGSHNQLIRSPNRVFKEHKVRFIPSYPILLVFTRERK